MSNIDNSLIFDEKKLNRIPPIFVLLLIIMLGLPVIALNYFSLDFSSSVNNWGYDSKVGLFVFEAQIRNYYRQTLLEWSTFLLATITFLLSFTQYHLTKDRIALTIGLAILVSGLIEAAHTFIADNFSFYFIDRISLDAIIWTFSNTVSGLIFIIGLLLVLKGGSQTKRKILIFISFNTFLFIGLFSLIYFATSIMMSPAIWLKSSIFSRPYELTYLFIYLFITLFIYPKLSKKYPSILTNCILYVSITQVVIAIYLMLLPNSPGINAYNIAYFIKIIVYLIPFSCLIINYIFSYNAMLAAQGKLKVSQGELEYIAAHDALTNLYNRREFEEILAKTIANHSRNDSIFALFVIDIDNFKSINDTLGHAHGDNFLKQFATQLNQLTRKEEILSRIGGDEFTLITCQLKSPSSARKLAERIIEGINTPYSIYGKLVNSTVSVGIALYPLDGNTTDELLKKADIAMYSAKKQGKNTYRFYTEKLGSQQRREAEIESHLREALKNNELGLLFQPIYDLVTKEIVGSEVQLSWYNTTLGNIPLDEFISVAENSGLIINIGNWLLSKTCEQAKLWYEQYKKHLLFSVSISPIQLEDKNFLNSLKKILEICDYPAEYLDITITGSLLMKNNAHTTDELNNMHALGVNISIDDFGIGYSSLNNLQSLPVNTLKIDKLFVSDIQNDLARVIVIDTIIKLAHEFGMNVVAEGIETKEQLNYLVAKKCYLGKGSLFGAASKSTEFEKLAYMME